jgi:cytochrome c oxidase cbb3-type subunit III
MPAFAEMLKPEEIQNVAAYVASLSGLPISVGKPEAGKQLFADNCAACHGDNAQGNRDFGAPNLSDAIWLHGKGEAAIIAQVTAPKHGVMPAWGARLGDTTVKELAVYVHSLGGGE